MIALESVSKSFDGGASFAVKDISLRIAEGETLVLLGSSGCGKTTTLKMINRLIEPTAGQIEVDNRNVMDVDPVELRRSIGYVFQGIGLFPHMRVADNVSIVLRLLGWPRRRRRRRANELLSLVDLDPNDYALRYPAELSGGQQQRVGVARALAADPAYLLMDEPFGALDALTRDTLQKELLQLKERLRKTIVFVTHDIVEAMVLADRIAVMHEGRLEQLGTRDEILSNPATPFVRDLFAKAAEQLSAFEEHRQ
ncbi:MAG TPA: betaine/proline/choline family ABC transporter ATP-binding protein [Phycisphaerae bacterium]|nr:betaine/proline/choline family ABC transporter ATP-binding protein [Phycisphaerae bacterium]